MREKNKTVYQWGEKSCPILRVFFVFLISFFFLYLGTTYWGGKLYFKASLPDAYNWMPHFKKNYRVDIQWNYISLEMNQPYATLVEI